MQTVVKQAPQPKANAKAALVPDDVKKVIKKTTDTAVADKAISGALLRLLDANSDCV